MSENVQVVTDLPKPPKAAWKKRVSVVVTITLVALGASAIYTGLKRGGQEETENTETTSA